MPRSDGYLPNRAMRSPCFTRRGFSAPCQAKDPPGRYRTHEALEGQLAQRLRLDQVLDRHQRALADQDLAVAGLVAQARGEVRYRADRGVLEPSLEADPPEGGVAMGDADAEAQIVTPLAPFLGKSGDVLAHRDRHAH